MSFLKVYNLKRDKKIPKEAIYVGRGTKWGNPYIMGKDGTRAQVLNKFKRFVLPHLEVRELKGKSLICFCSPEACHADLIMKKANLGVKQWKSPNRK